MNRPIQYLDLYGEAKGVIATSRKYTLFIFDDELYGKLSISTPNELFNPHAAGEKRFHIKAFIKAQKKLNSDTIYYQTLLVANEVEEAKELEN